MLRKAWVIFSIENRIEYAKKKKRKEKEEGVVVISFKRGTCHIYGWYTTFFFFQFLSIEHLLTRVRDICIHGGGIETY